MSEHGAELGIAPPCREIRSEIPVPTAAEWVGQRKSGVCSGRGGAGRVVAYLRNLPSPQRPTSTPRNRVGSKSESRISESRISESCMSQSRISESRMAALPHAFGIKFYGPSAVKCIKRLACHSAAKRLLCHFMAPVPRKGMAVMMAPPPCPWDLLLVQPPPPPPPRPLGLATRRRDGLRRRRRRRARCLRRARQAAATRIRADDGRRGAS